MALSRHVIAAYKRIYTKDQLTAALTQALNDRAAGVVVTQVNFQEGGGSGQMIQGDPNEIIEILEIALAELDNERTPGPGPLATVANFSTRRTET